MEDTGIPGFRGVFIGTNGSNVTATLTSLSEASTVEGIMVLCDGESSREDPLTITVAGELLWRVTIANQCTHRSTSPSTQYKSFLYSKPTQFL